MRSYFKDLWEDKAMHYMSARQYVARQGKAIIMYHEVQWGQDENFGVCVCVGGGSRYVLQRIIIRITFLFDVNQ